MPNARDQTIANAGIIIRRACPDDLDFLVEKDLDGEGYSVFCDPAPGIRRERLYFF
jgi:hypothetical protein